jgi:signal transduction histidine kinase
MLDAGRSSAPSRSSTTSANGQQRAELRRQIASGPSSARRQAEEASRGEGGIPATLSHEIRTPLNARDRLSSRSCAAGPSTPATLAHALEVIDRNASAQAGD